MLRTESNVSENLARLNERIAEAALKAGRQPEEITLVGVSKTQPAESVLEAIRAGVLHFGENRVQEAAEKVPLVRQLLQALGQGDVWLLVRGCRELAGAQRGVVEAECRAPTRDQECGEREATGAQRRYVRPLQKQMRPPKWRPKPPAQTLGPQ